MSMAKDRVLDYLDEMVTRAFSGLPFEGRGQERSAVTNCLIEIQDAWDELDTLVSENGNDYLERKLLRYLEAERERIANRLALIEERR